MPIWGNPKIVEMDVPLVGKAVKDGRGYRQYSRYQQVLMPAVGMDRWDGMDGACRGARVERSTRLTLHK